ncbi:MAG: hypothetical protein AMS25_18930 [Gemmatimonas sp. SM23_52]|nr:MAG: hypothetical protein AMS25_18930 [Gemmatimonas sp. SM23_52]
MALGATAADVLSLLTRQDIGPVLAGLALGLGLALAARRLLASLLFGVAAADPLTYAGVAVVFVAIATLASRRPPAGTLAESNIGEGSDSSGHGSARSPWRLFPVPWQRQALADRLWEASPPPIVV